MLQAPGPVGLEAASYNEQGLPTAMELAGGRTLTYRYSAEGQRTLKKTEGGERTQYVKDGSVTLAVVTNGSLQHWNLTLPGGEVIGRVPEGSGRRYYLKDHLGSIRAVLDGGGSAVETRDYYPFGLPMPGRYQREGDGTKEDFTGHVKDTETGLHYAGARYYSAAFARYGVIDPHADKYPDHSPYHYAGNNPLKISDPSGKFWVDVVAGEGIRAMRWAPETNMMMVGFGTLLPGAGAVWSGIKEGTMTGNTDHSPLDPGSWEWVMGGASAWSAIRQIGAAGRGSVSAVKNARRADRGIGVVEGIRSIFHVGTLNTEKMLFEVGVYSGLVEIQNREGVLLR